MNYTIGQLKYPIGKYIAPGMITEHQISEWIAQIESLPDELRSTVSGMSDKQLNTVYRDGGWTLRQVVHHICDSHLNAYIRYKLAFTEDNPTIKPYYEDRWAECAEARTADVTVSIELLYNLHRRWVLFMRSLKYPDFERSYIHPEHNKLFSLKEITGLYAWHGQHHLNHIIRTKQLNEW